MSKLGKERHSGHFRNCINEDNAKNEQCRLFKKGKGAVLEQRGRRGAAVVIFEFFS